MNDYNENVLAMIAILVFCAAVLHFITGCAPAAAKPRPAPSVTEKEYLLLWAETEIMNSCETGKPVRFGSIDGQPYFFVCRPGTDI
jgi:hypothetical protein